MNKITLDRVIRWIIGIGATLLLAWLVTRFANLVAYGIIAVIISYILDPIVNRMQASGVNRTLAIVMTLSSVILMIIWVSTSIIPIITNQMVSLFNQLNIDNIRMIAKKVEARMNTELPFLPQGYLQENLAQIVQNLFNVSELPSAIGDIIGIFTNIFSAFLVIPFATFFFLKDGSKIRRNLLQLVPNKYFETTLSLIDKIETRLGIYFKSVFIQSLLVATFSWIFLTIAGLNNALSVGISAGLANTIPYFGPIIGYILSIVVSIIETGDLALVLPCILAILAVQVMDNLIFQPFIFSRSADIHPVAVLFAILLGAEIGGILGMLLAIPTATIIKITVNQISWSFNNYYVFRSRT